MISAKPFKMFVQGKELSRFEARRLYTHSNDALPFYLVTVKPIFFSGAEEMEP